MRKHICLRELKKYSICDVCRGRKHFSFGCNKGNNKNKDCTWQRHLMLYKNGHRVGLINKAKPMLSEWNLVGAKLAGIDIEPYKGEYFNSEKFDKYLEMTKYITRRLVNSND